METLSVSILLHAQLQKQRWKPVILWLRTNFELLITKYCSKSAKSFLTIWCSSQLFPVFSFLPLPFPMLFLFSLMIYKYSSHCPGKPCAHTSVTSTEMNFSLPIVEKCVTWNSKCIRAPDRDIIRKYERRIAH